MTIQDGGPPGSGGDLLVKMMKKNTKIKILLHVHIKYWYCSKIINQICFFFFNPQSSTVTHFKKIYVILKKYY